MSQTRNFVENPYLLVLICLLVSLGLFAQEKCTIVGTVVDRENGMHVSNALLLFADGKVVAEADSDGQFEFQLSSRNSFQLQVHHPGYHPSTLSIDLHPAEHLSLPIELEPRRHQLVELSQQEEGGEASSVIVSRSSAVTAKAEGQIAGVIYDLKTGKPLKDVNVFVRGTGKETISDALGRFQIAVSSDTTHILAVGRRGYCKEWYDVVVEEHKQLNVQIKIKPYETSARGGAVVGEIAPKEPEAAYLDEAEIESIAPMDSQDMLYTQFPQLLSAKDLAAELRRAIFFLYVDGIEWNRRYLNYVDAYAVQRVTIWTGLKAPPRYKTEMALFIVEVITYR